MKKITFMLLAIFAAVSANAQELVPMEPEMASKFNNAKSAADLCGVYTWNYRTASRRTAQPDTLTAEGSKLADGSSVVTISLLDAENDSILIWGMFDKPLHAFVSIQEGYYPSIKIARDQLINTYKNTDGTLSNVKLNLTMYRKSDGAAFTSSSFSLTVYPGRLEIYSTTYDYWLYQTIVDGPYANYVTGSYYLPGFQMVENETYKDYNGVMRHEFVKSMSNYVSGSYPVNIVQNGNTVSVTNFYNSGKTVDFILHADGTFEIPQQIGYTANELDYQTFAADFSAGTNVTVGPTIEGTGTEEGGLNWGNWKLVSTDNKRYTGAINNGFIGYLDFTANKFNFPVALTISDAGIASFSSQKNVDFSQATKLGDTPETVALTPNVVTEFTAQKATLEAVDAPIPANMGVFVRGEAGDYEVPTLAEAADLNIVNKLQPTSNQEVQGDGSTIYALGMQDGKPGVMLVTAGTTIAQNKAYLEGNFGSEAKFISFDGETTAIETIDNVQSTQSAVYNLQGQRVGENYRGIVIKNGKKVMK